MFMFEQKLSFFFLVLISAKYPFEGVSFTHHIQGVLIPLLGNENLLLQRLGIQQKPNTVLILLAKFVQVYECEL